MKELTNIQIQAVSGSFSTLKYISDHPALSGGIIGSVMGTAIGVLGLFGSNNLSYAISNGGGLGVLAGVSFAATRGLVNFCQRASRTTKYWDFS